MSLSLSSYLGARTRYSNSSQTTKGRQYLFTPGQAVGPVIGLPGQPAIPAALGWNALTLGPTLNYNPNVSSVQSTGNWFPYTLQGTVPIVPQAVPQGDGSLLIQGPRGATYNAAVATAYKVNSAGSWRGKAFCLPMYIRIIFKLTQTVGANSPVANFPALWSDEIRYLGQVGNGSLTFPGQANGTDHHMEPDFLEYTRTALNRCSMGGIATWTNSGAVGATTNGQRAVTPFGATYHTLEIVFRKGVMPSTQGSQHVYFDGAEVFPLTGTPAVIVWDPWDDNDPAPAYPPSGSKLCSFMDKSQLVMLAGTTTTGENPLQIKSWEIWQPSDSINIVQ